MAERPTRGGYPNHGPEIDLTSAEALAVDWLVWLGEVKGRAQNTLLSYNAVLRNYLAWCARVGVNPLQPGLTDLETFMTRKHTFNGRKGSASSQRTDAAALKGWFGWMKERDLLPKNPAVDLSGPQSKRKDGRPIEDDHWRLMWALDLPPRSRAVLGLGFFCGLRLAEMHALTTSQITETRIRNFVRKGGGEDTLPWRDVAEVHALQLPWLLPDLDGFVSAVNHTRNNHDRLFPWQTPKGMYKWMGKLCGRLNIPPYTPHQMRHSAATNLLRAGIKPHVVMRLMNHTSFDTTMSYVRAGSRDLREWLDEQRSNRGYAETVADRN